MNQSPQTVMLDDSAKVFAKVEHYARIDARQIKKDWITIFTSTLGVAGSLIFEYVALASILTAILFTDGVNAYGNALVVLVLTIGYHVIVEIDGAKDLEAVMRKIVKVSIPFIAIALASLIAFQYFIGTLDFLGSSTGSGDYTESGSATTDDSAIDIGLAFASAVGALLAPLPAILVLFACSLLLLVSLHTVHLLLGVIDRRLEAIQAAQNRYPIVRAYRNRIEERSCQARRIEIKTRIEEAQVPTNLRRAFANDAYRLLNGTLTEMRIEIEKLPPGEEKGDLIKAGLPRRFPIPADITDLEIGRKRIAEVRDAVRPAAIKMALDAEYANEPDVRF